MGNKFFWVYMAVVRLIFRFCVGNHPMGPERMSFRFVARNHPMAVRFVARNHPHRLSPELPSRGANIEPRFMLGAP